MNNWTGICAQNRVLAKRWLEQYFFLGNCSNILCWTNLQVTLTLIPRLEPKQTTFSRQEVLRMPSHLQRGAAMHDMGFCICPDCPQNRNQRVAVAQASHRARRRELLCECEWCDLWERFRPDIVSPLDDTKFISLLVLV